MSDETSRTDAAAYRARLDNRLMEERHDAVLALREAGQEPFANGFAQRHTAAEARALGGEQTSEELEAAKIEVSVAGRIRFFRRMGKAAFVKIQDRSTAPPADDEEEGFLQLFLSVDALGQEAFDASRALMLGDIVGVEGTLMRTRTGELSVLAREIRVLTKSIRPLPEKYKGLSDVEQRFRQRYVDLLVNAESRRIFRTRSLIVQRIREFLMARDFMEVETPMMHVTPGGAVARPFVTHHNALDIDLFLRIAPELYLKRLLVGGFERVFELNRNFRNEGLSRQHNPEFTMLEFYQAYASYEHLMDLTEEMISGIAEELHGRRADGKVIVEAEGHCIDLTPGWRRISVTAAVAEHFGLDESEAGSREFLLKEARQQHIENPEAMDTGKLLMEAFEHNVEHRLIQPTFVTGFPASVSPLARRSADNPDFVDRFELFICGRELANAFNELNDPEDQYMRFCAQLREREAGDDEAMPMDEDYIRALEYGMPPAAGEGIGIDRLTMLLTGAESIREVILFPHLRPEQSA